MVDVYLATFNIGVGCPNDTPVNTPTHIEGTYSYRFVNRGDEDGVVNLTVSISDSAGHHDDFPVQGVVVRAGGDAIGSGTPFLNAVYGTAGPVAVKIRVVISGAMNDSKDALCSFNVT